MKDVRIGNDISVIWSLYSDQKPFLLDGLKISVYLKGMYGKTKIEDYTIKDNEIHWTFFGKDQKHTGKYSLTLVINEGAEGMVTTDVCDLVRLVSCTCQADGSDEDGVQTETIAVNSEVELLSGGFGRIDTALDPMSENAVSNRVITAEFGKVNEATSGLKTQMADDKAELMANLEQVGVLANEAAMRSSRNEQNKVDKDKVATINGKSLIDGDNIVIGEGIYEIKYDYLNENMLSGEDIAFNKEVFDKLNKNEVSALYVTISIDNHSIYIIADSFVHTPPLPDDDLSCIYLTFSSDTLPIFGLQKKIVAILSNGQCTGMPISSNIVDDEMSDDSENSVQNKVVKSYVDTSIAQAITNTINASY